MPRKARSQRKAEIYAVAEGFSPAPGIFSSWGHAHPLVTGYRNAQFQGFTTVAEAEMYLARREVKEYIRMIRPASTTSFRRGEKAYYAVANGRSPGVHEYYFGDDGAEPKVVQFSGACHKRFPTLVEAESFIADWANMYSFVCRGESKQELCRVVCPLGVAGSPIAFVKEPEMETTDGIV
ncbi:hypothetical protein BP6252_02370 [Coleophoma cylindrospora]|uniref:Ribonuclease H1 N-terminal domain-containing protein n=1 Tax=Coleophoma cylindrospora TaxID=1849047 RepID=A0A3D8SEL2_9HELO|nr:hypothetical protein BP6252_02370 [Coleophoma cylindrospora]